MNNSQEPQSDFGQFFRSKRLEQGLTLRGFCEKYGYDPGNISKLERNVLSPSIDEEKLEGLAKALHLAKGSPDWVAFFDLAYLAKGTIPQDIRNSQQLSAVLPAFYRSLRGEKLTKDKIKKLLNLLQEANSHEPS